MLNATRSTTYARTMALIAPAARSTARWSTPSYFGRGPVELTTTRQAALQLEPIKPHVDKRTLSVRIRTRSQPLPPRVTVEDRNAHRAFVATLVSEAIWLDYFAIKSVAA
jgi:hypothetical protein